MTDMQTRAGLSVAASLAAFIEQKALPGTGVTPEKFWTGLAELFAKFVPENRALLADRDRIQAQIDAWHTQNPGLPKDMSAYQAFLRDIGYLVAEPAPFKISSKTSTMKSRRWRVRSSSSQC